MTESATDELIENPAATGDIKLQEMWRKARKPPPIPPAGTPSATLSTPTQPTEPVAKSASLKTEQGLRARIEARRQSTSPNKPAA